jgi:hypothetical protein
MNTDAQEAGFCPPLARRLWAFRCVRYGVMPYPSGYRDMNIKDTKTWVILTLIGSTLLGPGIVWKYKENNISELTIQIEQGKAEVEKNKQTVEMYEKLSQLLLRQAQLNDEIKVIDLAENDNRDIQLLRNSSRRAEVLEQIKVVKGIIAKITGKSVEQIEGGLEAPPPIGLRLQAK